MTHKPQHGNQNYNYFTSHKVAGLPLWRCRRESHPIYTLLLFRVYGSRLFAPLAPQQPPTPAFLAMNSPQFMDQNCPTSPPLSIPFSPLVLSSCFAFGSIPYSRYFFLVGIELHSARVSTSSTSHPSVEASWLILEPRLRTLSIPAQCLPPCLALQSLVLQRALNEEEKKGETHPLPPAASVDSSRLVMPRLLPLPGSPYAT